MKPTSNSTTMHYRYVVLVAALLVAMLASPAASVLLASAPSLSSPDPTSKNSTDNPTAAPAAEDYVLLSTDADAHNRDNNIRRDASPGLGASLTPSVLSKNAGNSELSTITSGADLSAVGLGHLLTCGESGNQNWYWMLSSYGIVRQCTLTLPRAGAVFISANVSLAGPGPYEANLRLGIDESVSGEMATDRWVNVYTDSAGGSDVTGAVSYTKVLAAGTHTFYLLAKRYAGAGTMLIYDSTITAMFIDSSTTLQFCASSGNTDWTTSSSTFQVIRSCSLTLPQDGYVFISADGSFARQNGPYEGQTRIGIDSTAGDSNIDRWVDVYDDSGDGSDESVALTVLQPVSAGAHTFYSLGARYIYTGTALLYDPTLTVIYIASPSVAAVHCGVSGNASWTTSSTTFQIIRQCTLSVPQTGWVFIAADGTVARRDGDFEALFEISYGDAGGDANIDRWVNVYADSDDGSERTVAITVLKYLKAGTYPLFFLGKRYAGAGTVLVYDPTLTVIAPGGRTVFPVVVYNRAW